MRLRDLQRDTKTCAMRWGEEELKLTYRPTSYTPALEAELRSSVGDGTIPWQADALVAFLGALLTEWDLLDDEGQALPPTKEVLDTLPVPFLAEVMLAIGEDMRPGEAQRPSAAG